MDGLAALVASGTIGILIASTNCSSGFEQDDRYDSEHIASILKKNFIGLEFS